MIKLKNILLEQPDEFPTPRPGKYNLRFEKRYKNGEREPVTENNVEVTAEDIKEFEKNKRLYPSYDITNQDFWNGIASEISNHPQSRIARIRITMTSATKPEFEIYITSIDAGTPQMLDKSYEESIEDIEFELEQGDRSKANCEGYIKIGDKKYGFAFETDEPGVHSDQVMWDDDSFQQETGLDETDIVAKLNA